MRICPALVRNDVIERVTLWYLPTQSFSGIEHPKAAAGAVAVAATIGLIAPLNDPSCW